ncbi:unnamed protein product [Cylicostephanus goldi]|uniref:Uncharacterized protein n=1 Tax=Cylicostephanus goldi TaxID=71465 RepID=A0A3P7N592_CYLGO|nr:unnamed protein product [Cylicostephanus goldi]
MGPEYPMESCLTVSTRVFLQITKILKPKNVDLELVTTDIADVKSTLSRVPSTSLITSPGCELRFYNILPNPSEDNILHTVFFDFEVVKAAPLLITDAVCEITDEQLIHLRASRLYLEAHRILEKGINELILVRFLSDYAA